MRVFGATVEMAARLPGALGPDVALFDKTSIGPIIISSIMSVCHRREVRKSLGDNVNFNEPHKFGAELAPQFQSPTWIKLKSRCPLRKSAAGISIEGAGVSR